MGPNLYGQTTLLTSFLFWRNLLRKDDSVFDVQVAMSVLVLVYRHALALHDLNEICTPRGKRAVSQKLQSCLTRLRHNVSLDMYDMTVQMCEVTLKAKECLAQCQSLTAP